MIFVGTLGAFFGKILAAKGFDGSLILPLAANAFISSLTDFINLQNSNLYSGFGFEEITVVSRPNAET